MINFNLNSLNGLGSLPLPSSKKIALALLTASSVATYYYFFSQKADDLSNSEYWINRKWFPELVKEVVTPFLLPFDHPTREVLDQIYSTDRSYQECKPIGIGTSVKPLTHPQLERQGFIIKEPEPYTRGWETRKTALLKRVKGHHIANNLIRDRNFTHVRVTQNWLYPRPQNEIIINWTIHHLTRPLRLALKTLGLSCPKWLKIADKIFLNRFIVVEEFIDIKRPNKEQLDACGSELLDEFIEVALKVGFQDAHDRNYCFDEKKRLVLFDLDEYSSNKAKRLDQGKSGVNIMFQDCLEREAIAEKVNKFFLV